ncbi:hypothetical protein BJ973_002872 [Actinoplanes tereljensis]|uniref:Uncharacterized protein n=1 Tax=Paractinoplanes tereljensis TaxID=571912 RepID=A0A919TUQ8_9ACTN|nr:hypothetical protein [Actinoplanes tereljensis]GIF22549.1 hypothetical protein Ate02nite_52790 [Actinoplanes tereljensis]
MDVGTVFAGVIGGSLTLAGQHLLGVAQDWRKERTAIVTARTGLRERLVQQVHAMGQVTAAEYVEASLRGSLDSTQWDAAQLRLSAAWLAFSDAHTLVPRLGSADLVAAAHRAHTMFALRINCFFNEHPGAINQYLSKLKDECPELTAEDFRWNLDVYAANRRAYWDISHEIDRISLQLGNDDANTSLRRLRRVHPAQPAVRDISDLYREHLWPKGHYIALSRYRR